MNTSYLSKKRWLPLAVLPLVGATFLSACSSDDDTVVVTPPTALDVGDANANGILDAVEIATTGGTDANSNNVDDTFESPVSSTVTAADTNSNNVDDSFEVEFTLGTDANADGIDDAAAEALAAIDNSLSESDLNANGIPDALEAANTGGTDANSDLVDDLYAQPAEGSTATAADTNGNGVDDSFEVALTGGNDLNSDGVDDDAAALVANSNGDGNGNGNGNGTATGNLNAVAIGNDQGTVDFNFENSTLTGTVTLADGVTASDVWIYSGVAASRDPGNPSVQLVGDGSTYSIPNPLSADQSSGIANNMLSGNLFVLVNTTSGDTLRSLQILPADNSVIATYTSLSGSNGSTVASGGEAFLNYNKNSGEYSAVLTVTLSASDVDGSGAPITIGNAHIHTDSISGNVIIGLTGNGDSTIWSATGVMDAAALAVINTNNGWWNAHQNDGTTPGASFLSGQIQAVAP